MGWASGTNLMKELIQSFEEIVTDTPSDQAIRFWERAIRAFEDSDWDCQEECLGISASWDAAYYNLNPFLDGYKNGLDYRCFNPYLRHTEGFDLWEEGKAKRLADEGSCT